MAGSAAVKPTLWGRFGYLYMICLTSALIGLDLPASTEFALTVPRYWLIADPSLADLCGNQRAKSVPPRSSRFVADVDAAFVQKIVNFPKQERKPNIHHQSQGVISGLILK